MFDRFILKYRLWQAKKLNKYEMTWKFEKLVQQGKLNLKDERILKYYIESKALKCKNLNSYICYKKHENFKDENYIQYLKEYVTESYAILNNLLKDGITIEEILENSFFESEIIDIFIKFKNCELESESYEDIETFVQKLKIINVIIKNSKYKQKLLQSLNIQNYAEKYIESKYRDYNIYNKSEFLECVSFFQNCGYVPFANTREVGQLLIELIGCLNPPKFKEFCDGVHIMNKFPDSCKQLLDLTDVRLGEACALILLKSDISIEEKAVKWFIKALESENYNKKFAKEYSAFLYGIVYDIGENYTKKFLLDYPKVEKKILDFFQECNRLKSPYVKEKIIRFLSRNYEKLSFDNVHNIVEFSLEFGENYLELYDISDNDWFDLSKNQNEKMLKIMRECNRLKSPYIKEKIIRFLSRNYEKLSFDNVHNIVEFSLEFDKNASELYNVLNSISDNVWFALATNQNEKMSKIMQENNKIKPLDAQKAIKLFFVKNYEKLSLDNMHNIVEFSLNFDLADFKVYIMFLNFVINDSSLDLTYLLTNLEAKGKVLKIIQEASKNHDFNTYAIKYIFSYFSNITFENISCVFDIIKKIEISNSAEFLNFKNAIFEQLFLQKNPLEKFEQLESIFLKNNLPTVGKIFSVFKILHPKYEDYDFSISSSISPTLKKCPINLKEKMWGNENLWRDIIIFSDLVKASLGSNNRSMKDYLESIHKGNVLFLGVSLKNIQYEQLSDEYKQILIVFGNHLNTLYNNTLRGKEKINKLTGDTLKDINHLYTLFSSNSNFLSNLPDRIIKMYFHFAGFDTFDAVKKYMEEKIKNANERNRDFSKNKVVLEKGDFIKGIGKIDYLHNILQNGVTAKEFLGASADKDSTPLDTDLSRIIEKKTTIKEMISCTPSSAFGPIYLLLKNNERFLVTQEKLEEKETFAFDSSRLETFKTLSDDHYGIRTGFASSEIDCILMEEYDSRVGLEIAMNGFYIPVADFEGKIVFTPKDYDDLREKMDGLSYYNKNEYSFAKNLVLPKAKGIVKSLLDSESEIVNIQNKIYEIVEQIAKKYDMKLQKQIDIDLTEGTVELINTGSTSRKTYVPGDVDFDFIMRLDKNLLLNTSKLNDFKSDLLKAFHIESGSAFLSNEKFILNEAYLSGYDKPVKIDITFVRKTDKIEYSTDMALNDYLETIKKQDKEKYKLILANIVLAKKVLKNANVYKGYRSDNTQGGLSGVGIENWILQSGGSFTEAIGDFLKHAHHKSFQEFKKEYFVWDFGSNHFFAEKNIYPHDNFVADKMSEDGYNKMKKALENYITSLDIKVINDNDLIETYEVENNKHR